MQEIPEQLQELFNQLRRRRFSIGIDDYHALRQSLYAGFGLSSREKLRDLCCDLWAKSCQERAVLRVLFDQLKLPDWELPTEDHEPLTYASTDQEREKRPALSEEIQSAQVLPLPGGLPDMPLDDEQLFKSHFVFVPQFPLTYREIVQAWRRLRRPVRVGPPTDLDAEATVARRCRSGIASPAVLVPRRRNTARLLLLVDRQGSMTPFHRFIEEVCLAIKQAGKLERVAHYYFHNLPAEGADKQVLAPLANELFPTLDSVLSNILPLTDGYLYTDPELIELQPLADVLRTHAVGAAVVLLSDAGAAHGYYDILRLLNTVAFLKALRSYTSHYVWLNPLPREDWKRSTAAQIARYVPMLPLDRDGMYRAVNVLRGQPYPIERPI